MIDLEEVLARAQSPGVFVERRHFTLSQAHAVEKLRTFALRRPGQAVLELMQAAVCANATYIAIDTRPDRLVVAWVGSPPIEEAQLDSLFDYLFADALTGSHRHLVQLAIAINAMLRDERGTVRIETGSGEPGETLRLDLDSSGAGTVGRSDRALAGTYVVMERRRAWWRFWARPAITEEQVLVEEQCRYTPVPILLNGAAPFGYRASRTVQTFHPSDEVSFDEGPGGRRGCLFLTPHESRVEMVVAGVRITTASLHELGLFQQPQLAGGIAHWFSGVVCDDGLRKTADQSDIVRDEQFEAMLHALRGPCETLAQRHAPTWVSPMPAGHPTADAPDLPELIEQLAPRSPISLDFLLALDPEVPLFRVTPDQPENVPSIRALADPLRLPFPVLLLTDDQAAVLVERLGRPLGVLTDPSSVELTVRASAGRGGLARVGMPEADPFDRSWQSWIWSGTPPAGLISPGQMMILEVDAGRTRRLHAVELHLPGMVVTVEGHLPEELPSAALKDLVLRYAARAAFADADLPMLQRAHIVAAVIRVLPTFAGSLRLELPPGWAANRLDFSLEDWADHIVAATRLPVAEPISDAYECVEAAVAVGHLGSHLSGVPHAGVLQGTEGWTILDPLTAAPSAPALLVWDEPPPPRCVRLSSEPFVTVHGAPAADALEAGAACLQQHLRNQRPHTKRARHLQQRWLEALAQGCGRPDWSPIPTGCSTRLQGGVRGAHLDAVPIPFALARAGHHLSTHTLPDWVQTGTLPGGWWARHVAPEGWLAIPRNQRPTTQRPQILVDTGLEWRWDRTPGTLPSVGVLRISHPSRDAIWPFLVDLWTRFPTSPVPPATQSWVAIALRVLPANSLLRARLQALDSTTGEASEGMLSAAETQLLRTLQDAEETELDLDGLLEQQSHILHAALGRLAVAPPEDR